MATAIWSTLTADGDFRCVTDPDFLAGYLGVPLVRLQIIQCLRRHTSLTLPNLARELGWTRNGLKSHVEVLEDVGLLERFTARMPGSFRPAACYRLDEVRADLVADAVGEAFRRRHSAG